MPPTRVRPGPTIRNYLLATGEATIAHLRNAYRREVLVGRQEGATRGGQRGMSYNSMVKLVWFAKRLGLVEAVGWGEAVASTALQMMTSDPNQPVVPAQPQLWALTPLGRGSTDWDDLRGAYMRGRG